MEFQKYTFEEKKKKREEKKVTKIIIYIYEYTYIYMKFALKIVFFCKVIIGYKNEN